MIITSAEKQKNNSDMIRIYIDHAYAFSMPEEEYLKRHLYERTELSEEEITAIHEEINIKLAKQRAIRMLASRDRSEHEIREKLIQLGFDQDVAEGAIDQLKAIGYVNDRLFARKFVADRLKLKPMSKKALGYELQRKGIQADIINEVIDEYELDESVIAYRIAKKKYGKYDCSDLKIQRKISSFLAFRGFSHEIIRATLEQMNE